MSIPAWTSLVRVVMEVDHPDVEVLPTDDIVYQTRTFLYQQIEDIYDDLLDTHSRHRQAQRNAIAILENVLSSDPAVFTRFVHKFTFFTSASTDRITFQEFLRFHRLYVFSRSPVVHTLPGFAVYSSPREACLSATACASGVQPLLLLARDQVSVVCAAVRQKFDELLEEHPPLVHGGGALSVCPLHCGAGRFQKVQHDTVARSALALLVDDLKMLQYHDIPQPLLEHLCLADKKCALATFQAKSRAQRLHAVGAALRRIGMVEMAARLPHDTAANGASNARASASGATEVPCASVRSAAETPIATQRVVAPDDDDQGPLSMDDLPNLSTRVAALEVWAHSLDRVQVADGSDSATALACASDLVRSLVQQAVRDHFQEQSLPTSSLADRRSCSHTARRVEGSELVLADKIKQLEEQVRALAAKSSTVSNVTVFDCPAPDDGQSASVMAAHTRQVQQDQLLGMHTDAISRTWQWTSSVILAMMQQRSTNLHMQQSLTALESRLAPLLDAASVGIARLPSAAPPDAPTFLQQQAHCPAESVLQEALPVTPPMATTESAGTLRSDVVSPPREDEPRDGSLVHGVATSSATDQTPLVQPASTEFPTLVVSDSE
eukprot:3283655-Amphidinium_carterae.2